MKKLFAISMACLLLAVAPLSAANAQGRERHPEIHEAIQALRKAKHHLEHADHDFGGHRVEAIQAIDNAIGQLETALQYDKK